MTLSDILCRHIDDLQHRIEGYEAELTGLRRQAADDIAWMSGIGPIPDDAVGHWRTIHDRWFTEDGAS